MRASIVIPSFNRVAYTQICAQFLQGQFGGDADVEVIVVDNGSSDSTRGFLSTLESPFRVVLNSSNRNFAGASNQGADLARGEYVVFLNNDTVPMNGWLESLLEPLQEPDVGIVGSKLLFPDDTIQHAGVVFTDTLLPAHMYYLFPSAYLGANVERDYQAVTGACLAIRRSLFFKIGGFDEGYKNSFEDIDLCLRVRDHSYRVVYTPKSVLYHFESVSEGRHDGDDANRRRFLSRWKHCIAVDELDYYRQDGFSTVPRIPPRMLSQALAQLQFERRRSETVQQILDVVTRDYGDVDRTIPKIQIPSNKPLLITLLPGVVTAGSALTVRVHLIQVTDPIIEGTVLRYSWKVRGTDIVIWSGVASRLATTVAPEFELAARMTVPSVDGSYDVIWSLENVGASQVVAIDAIDVAMRYQFECSARLPKELPSASSVRLIVRLRNRGTETWLPNGGLFLGYHWFSADGQRPVVWDGDRAPILSRVGYGEETVLEVRITSPRETGSYQFAWDLVQEGELWYSLRGATSFRAVIAVVSSLLPEGEEVGGGPGAILKDPLKLDATGERDMANLVAELRSCEEALQSIQRESWSKDQTIADIERQLTDCRTTVNDLHRLIERIQRGKALRVLNGIGRLRRRALSTIGFAPQV